MTELTQTDNAQGASSQSSTARYYAPGGITKHHRQSAQTVCSNPAFAATPTKQLRPKAWRKEMGKCAINIAACHLTQLPQFSFHHHHHHYHHHHYTVRLLTSTLISLTPLVSLPTLRTRACLATLGVERLEGACVHRATTKHCDPSNLSR